MRIVGGKHRGRPLKAPKGRGVRPTSDRTREAVFNILEHGIDGPGLAGAAIADVFAGAGALGLEALSRGAARAVFIDNDPQALSWCRANAGSLGEGRNATFLKLDACRLPPPPLVAGAPCAYVFLDPPYGSGLAAAALGALAEKGWIGAGSVCIAETAASEPLAAPQGFEVVDERTYGAARVTFLIRV